MNHQVSIYLQLRRFRRRLKSKQKLIEKRKRGLVENNAFRELREIGKNVTSFSEALDAFMPNHLLYLLYNEKSPLHYEKLKRETYKDKCIIDIPEQFSILTNPQESYSVLQRLVSQILYQSCKELWINYSNCKHCDLATQIFLDSILKDNHKFIKACGSAKVGRFITIGSVGGYGINDSRLSLMINSVGSPVILVGRNVHYNNIIPYKLRHYDGNNLTPQKQKGLKEIDSTDLIQYVIDSLSRFKRTLSQSARQDLGNVVGETISNAEEHSSLHNRYLIGYFEESNDKKGHYGLLNLVIMNSGSTIYEKFKNPEKGKPFNTKCRDEMQQLSDLFVKKGIFKRNEFTEENLWTLYSLQGGVSCIPPEIRKRGNGTIQFIESFFKLKGNNNVDSISHLTLVSGNTQIDFDGTYKINKRKNANGEIDNIMSFNESGSLTEKPDSRYVHHIEHYFPGTIIYAQLLINEDDLQNG